MLLNDLYQYVFGSKAHLNSTRNSNTYAQRIAKIQNDFAEIMEGEKTDVFRQLLRSIPTADLEKILFGNDTDDLTLHKISFPTDAAIVTSFQRLNNKYHYFTDSEHNEEFNVLFKGCKLLADFVENTDQDNDEMAYEQAYKILTIYGYGNDKNPFSNIEKYIRQHNLIQSVSPVQEALKHVLPVYDDKIDLVRWKKLIHDVGVSAWNYFQDAGKIKSQLSYDPESIKDITKGLAKLNYPRYADFPELAELCQTYHINNDIYERCLIVKAKQKTRDCLPDLMLDGAAVGHEGYVLLKLPMDDPYAYLLGAITNCCQSMGGLGERYVIDGITRENCGFYVLLKANHAKTKTPAMINGRINYEDFAIVGQAYSWVNRHGNFIFDSMENLRRTPDDAIASAMLKEYGKRVANSDKYPHIVRVMLGINRKKLPDLESINPYPEYLDYFQCDDSISQALVYVQPEKLKIIHDQCELILEQAKEKFFAHFHQDVISQIMPAQRIYTSTHTPSEIKKLFLSDNSIALWTSVLGENLERLPLFQAFNQLAPYSLSEAFHLFLEMMEFDLLNMNSFTLMMNMPDPKKAGVYGYLLVELKKAGLLTDEYRQLMFSKPDMAGPLGIASLLLNEAGLLKDSKYIEIIKNNFVHWQILTSAFILAAEEKKFSDDDYDYDDLIARYPTDSLEVVKAVIYLKKRNELNDQQLRMILLQPAKAFDTAKAIIELKKAHLFSDSARKLIEASPADANAIQQMIFDLARANLLSHDILFNIMTNKSSIFSLTHGIIAIAAINKLTKQNLSIILNADFQALSLAKLIVLTYQLKLPINKFRKLFVKHLGLDHAYLLVEVLTKLSKAIPQDKELINLFEQHLTDIVEFRTIVNELDSVNELSSENIWLALKNTTPGSDKFFDLTAAVALLKKAQAFAEPGDLKILITDRMNIVWKKAALDTLYNANVESEVLVKTILTGDQSASCIAALHALSAKGEVNKKSIQELEAKLSYTPDKTETRVSASSIFKPCSGSKESKTALKTLTC